MFAGDQKRRPLPVRSLVSLLGAMVALITAFAFPSATRIGYFKEAQTLAFKADLTASRAAQYIYAPEAPWRYDTDQLAAMSEIRSSTGAPIVQRILNVRNTPVMSKGEPLAWPTFARRAPIVALGSVVGMAEVSSSLRPLLTEVALVGLAAVLLAIGAYYAFAVLPLRVIDRSVQSLEQANDLFFAAAAKSWGDRFRVLMLGNTERKEIEMLSTEARPQSRNYHFPVCAAQ